ncbi:Ni/Fe hydrogenase subunit alpha [Desulfobacterales bacterium HSG17]|nr:Ni/Fe hydrogenase subunit alpha [Desulfobacterales bacterium HSG17]
MSVAKTIEIDPVTRVEGHGKIAIHLDESGKIEDTFFGVTEFRGFEKFCEGRMLWDMPTITNRICGFCPVSHHLASVKACEALLGVEPPPGATKLRELLHMGQMIHSHALHFFFCALPDTMFGENASGTERSLFGIMESNKKLAASAIKLRKAGQQIVDIVGGGRLHPIACLPGGMSKHLTYIERVEMLKGIGSAIKIAQKGMKMIKDMYAKQPQVFMHFASFPSLYMGMVKNENLELYDAPIRVIDQDGKFLRDFEAKDYLAFIEEKTAPTSWTKFTYFKESGAANRFYRVAPLARLNIAKNISTPLADAELQEFKKIGDGKPIHGSFFFHYARLIELLYAVERAKELLYDPEILSNDVRIPVKRCGGEGVGVLEAPRGTLIHHYWANEDGRLTKINLIVATAHNNEAMNRSVRIVAESIVHDGEIKEKDLNKLEMAIRCYDPCLSCSSHAFGQMPLEITICGHDKKVINRYEYGYMQR